MNSPPAMSPSELLMSQLLLMRHKTAMEAESMLKRETEEEVINNWRRFVASRKTGAC
jgi:hypothetical protein